MFTSLKEALSISGFACRNCWQPFMYHMKMESFEYFCLFSCETNWHKLRSINHVGALKELSCQL